MKEFIEGEENGAVGSSVLMINRGLEDAYLRESLRKCPAFPPHTSWGGRRGGLGIPCSKLSSYEYSKDE
jgi:hypothetical protein